MARRLYDSRVPQRGYHILYGAVAITTVLMTGYLTVRVMTVITERSYRPVDAVMACLLLGAELFFCMHGVGYCFNLVKCGRRQATAQPIMFARHAQASVAVLVAAYNEVEEVLEETLAAVRAMDYPFTLYLLDDSTKPECRAGAERVAATYGARLVRRSTRAGYKAGAINDLMPDLSEKYIALLDADQRPMSSWLAEVVSYIEEHPNLALVQSPQHYVNGDGLPVCNSARYQQAMFYEYICEGKSYSNAMFCCGSNCVLRREALLSIQTVRNGRMNYFDETSVTEDFATSLLLQLKGWDTDYVNHSYAVGMGPETLTAYFTQQMRWAMGTLGRARPLLRHLIRHPRAMRPAQWWEYWLVSTYYAAGWAWFIFMLTPMAFMVADIQAIRTDTTLYWLFFVPYVLFTMNLFFFGMRLRKYPVKGIWLGGALNFVTFWIYMRAAVIGLLGIKRPFGVTAKGVGGTIPLRNLWMELTMFIGSWATSAWCLYHVAAGDGAAYAINAVWSTYHGILLSPLFFHYNRPVTVQPRPALFEPARLTA